MTPESSPSPTRTLIIPSPGDATWDVVAQWVAIGILIACTVAVILFVFNYLPKAKRLSRLRVDCKLSSLSSAVSLLSSSLLPSIPGFGKDDDGRVLRRTSFSTPLVVSWVSSPLARLTERTTRRRRKQERPYPRGSCRAPQSLRQGY